jgi:hypothetical protein
MLHVFSINLVKLMSHKTKTTVNLRRREYPGWAFGHDRNFWSVLSVFFISVFRDREPKFCLRKQEQMDQFSVF